MTRAQPTTALEVGPAGDKPQPRRRSEGGDTLIELLIATAILGVVGVAILLAFSTAIVSAAGYRSLATMDTVLRTAAAEATSQIQQEAASAFTCPANDHVTFTLPSGYSASAPSVSYWSGTATTPCAVNAAQLVTITVTYSNTSQSITFGVDDPANRSVINGVTASKLVFLSVGQPDGTVAGSTILPVVAVEDSAGNIVTNDLSPDTLAIVPGTGAPGATLSGTCAGSEFGGVITFQGCSISLAGTGYQLLASPTAGNSSVSSATSAAFTVTPGPASQLVFTASPGNTTSTTAFAVQPVVTVEDAFGNVVATDTSSVTLAIAANPATGTLTCSADPVPTVSSVATFTGCNINKAGTGYTLTATDGTLTAATSPTFNITVGPAAQLAFTTPPGNGTGGTAFSTQPVVTVEDAGGNTVTTNTSAVTLAIASVPASGVLTCNADPLNAVAGIASFAGCNINKANTGYTLTATDGGLSAATSPTFNITVGPATQLIFTTPPGNGTGGTALGTQPVVTVEDAGGNTVTTNTSAVTVAIAANPGTGTLNCTTNPLNAVNGLAAFAGCNINKIGTGYTLRATDGTLSATTSPTFNITVGPATQLIFTTPPGNGTGGTALGTQPVVTVEDAGGNTVTTNTSAVTLAIAANPANGTLTCTTNPLNAVAGIASFTGCKINKAGTGYTLTATDAGLSATTSPTFNITVGPATQLVFTTPPSNGTGGTALGTQPVVTVEDAGGNTVTTNTSAVTLALNPANGTLACTTDPLSAVNGVASFTGCSVNKAGTGYTLTATDGTLSPATSPTFTITVGPAAQLAFSASPGNTTSTTAFSTQPVVTVEDAGGNTVTTNTSAVTLAIAANPGTGTLNCTTNPLNAVNGVATFTGCKINKAGTGYTLTATDGTLTPPISSTFNITAGPATQLVFTTPPSNGTGGTALGTQPVVTVEDAGGNTVTTNTSAVTLALNPANGTLICTTDPLSAINGAASFTGCSVNKAGTGYTFTATDGTLTATTSPTFTITVGPAAQLAFSASPGNTTSTAAFSTQPVVTVEDAGGNTVTTNTSAVTLAIAANPGNGTLTCSTTNPPNTVNAVNGVASFTGCSINKAGTGYTLTATDGTLTPPISSAFNITVGPATQLIFTTSPGNGAFAATLPTQPVVTVEDAGGNTVTSSTASVTLAINSGTGTLACTTNPLNAVNGVATFAGCKLPSGTQGTFTLSAAAIGLGAISNSFTVSPGPASQLVFTTPPGNGTGGTALGTQPAVTVEDAGGNTVTTNTSAVTLALNPANGTLACTTDPLSASNGVASFTGCSVNKAGTGYTLTATDGTLSPATSPTFTITVGPATQLAFTTPPGNGTGGTALGTQPVVTVEDAGGNTVTTNTSAVTLAIAANPANGTLTCTTNPLNAVNGVATFTGCKINKAGAGYTLTATDGTLTATTSPTFTITVGPATQLVFTTPPSNGTGGTALGTQPVVTVEDAGGNTVTTNTSAVTLALNPANGTLICTTDPLSAVNGVASFTGCSVNKAGTGYTLTATDGTLTATTSPTFTITVGPAAQLGFSASPTGGTGGTAFGTQPAVTVEDAGGNTVTTNTSAVTLAIASGPASGALSCTTNPLNAVNGVTSFTGCSINKAGTGYTLTATDGTLTAATSPTFTITVGPASQLVLTTSPTASTGGTAFGTQPVVTVEDAGGNTVTTSAVLVALAINSGTGTLTCNNNPLNAVNGVATFAGCKITLGTQGAFTIKATATGLTTAVSNSFTVAGAATKLAINTLNNTTFGATWNPQPVVTVEDSSGDTVTTSTVSVSLGLATGNGTSGGCNASQVNAVNGVATFAGCEIGSGTAGSFSVNAAASGFTTIISNTFTIGAGPAAQLVFTTSPGTSTHNTAFGTQPVVTVEDASGNTVTGDSSSVTLTIGTNSGGGSLTCTSNPINASSGVATFAGCKISTAGSAYTLSATDGSLTSATSNSFKVS